MWNDLGVGQIPKTLQTHAGSCIMTINVKEYAMVFLSHIYDKATVPNSQHTIIRYVLSV